MSTNALAATFANRQTFLAVLAGVAAFGSVVGFCSAFAAFVSALLRNNSEAIATAATLGLAVSTPLALIVAGLDVRDVLTHPLPSVL